MLLENNICLGDDECVGNRCIIVSSSSTSTAPHILTHLSTPCCLKSRTCMHLLVQPWEKQWGNYHTVNSQVKSHAMELILRVRCSPQLPSSSDCVWNMVRKYDCSTQASLMLNRSYIGSEEAITLWYVLGKAFRNTEQLILKPVLQSCVMVQYPH